MASTIQDVARLAKVNPSTVSRVLNEKGPITPETKERVYKAMKELDYYPNSRARSLVSGLSYSIGVVLDAQDADSFSNYFFSRSLFGIEKVAQAHGYSVLIANSPNGKGKTIESLIKEKKVDGMIIPPSLMKPSLMKILVNFPYVLLGQPDDMPANSCWVDNNNEQGAILAVQTLIGYGYKRIAFFGGKESLGFSRRRVKGYTDALRDQAPIIIQDDTPDLPEKALEVLRNENRPDAFVCNDNLAANEVLNAARKLGLKVPDQVGIIAFDNYPLAEYTSPKLTVIDIDTALLGEESAELLFKRIENPGNNQQILLAAQLIERESASGR